MASHCAAEHSASMPVKQEGESERKRGGVCVCLRGGCVMVPFHPHSKCVNKLKCDVKQQEQ